MYAMGCGTFSKKSLHELTDGIHKVLSSTGYTGKISKKNCDIIMFKNIIDYIGYTGIRDRKFFSPGLS